MRPSRDEMLMGIARVVSLRSTCSRAHVGVVIAKDGRPLSTGYNGAPAGMPHCKHGCDCTGGELHWPECSSRQPCTVSVHAEANAIAFAARWGTALEGAELFTTLVPCLPCSQILVNAGITRVIYDFEYRDSRGLELLQNAGIAVEHLN